MKALKIPWTPPFQGPNPIDCKPMEPEKPTCCACQPHPEARAAGGGTEDFGDRASRPGDPPKNFDPKKANFNDLFSFLQASVKKVSNFLHLVSSEPDKSEKPEPKALGKKPEPETVSKTSKTGRKAQPHKCCECPKDPEEESRKAFKLKMLILCNLGCKKRRFCADWRHYELTQVLKEYPKADAVDGEGNPVQPRKWVVARQCDVRYTEELVNAPTKAKCLDRCEEVRRRLNFSWNPRDDKYGYRDPPKSETTR